jgi:hypothetical protein
MRLVVWDGKLLVDGSILPKSGAREESDSHRGATGLIVPTADAIRGIRPTGDWAGGPALV